MKLKRGRDEIIFVTKNKWKFEEVREMLRGSGIRLVQRGMELDEIQDKDVEKVAARKAQDAYFILNKPVLAEDTGLYIKAMNGYPGSLIRHFFYSIGPQGIIDFLKGNDREATAATALAYCDSEGLHSFTGEVSGTVSRQIKGTSRFDWDCIFVPEGHEETYGEMKVSHKNNISQRRKALDGFVTWFCSREKR